MAAPSENLERIVAKMKQTEKSCEQLLNDDHAKNEEFLNSTLAKLRKRKQQDLPVVVLPSKRTKVVAATPAPIATPALQQEEHDFSQYSYAQIRSMCKEYGLPGKGKREVLEERLAQHFRSQEEIPKEEDDNAAALKQQQEKEAEAKRLREQEERERAQQEEEEEKERARLEAVRLAEQQQQLAAQERLKQQALALEKAQREAAELERALREAEAQEAAAAAAAAEEARLAELNRQMRSKATATDLLKKLVPAPKPAATAAVAAATPGLVFSGGVGGNSTANKSNLSGLSNNSSSIFKPLPKSLNLSSSSSSTNNTGGSSFLQENKSASLLNKSNSTITTTSAVKPSIFGQFAMRVPVDSVPEPEPVAQAAQEFRFSDHDDDSSDGDEDGSDEENESTQKIPAWAKGDGLKQALKVQYERYHDLDEIFPEDRNPRDFPLEEIFKKKMGMRPRSSSAIWTQDAVTTEQKLEYQNSMKQKH